MSKENGKITVVYGGYNQHVVSDFRVIWWAKNIVDSFNKNHEGVTIFAGCQTMVDALRVMIIRDKIKHTDLELDFRGEVLQFDKNARLTHWPMGCCDIHVSMLAELVAGRR